MHVCIWFCKELLIKLIIFHTIKISDESKLNKANERFMYEFTEFYPAMRDQLSATVMLCY